MRNDSLLVCNNTETELVPQLKHLLVTHTRYDNYKIYNALNGQQLSFEFSQFNTLVPEFLRTIPSNNYKQLQILLNDDSIVVYPHIGSA